VRAQSRSRPKVPGYVSPFAISPTTSMYTRGDGSPRSTERLPSARSPKPRLAGWSGGWLEAGIHNDRTLDSRPQERTYFCRPLAASRPAQATPSCRSHLGHGDTTDLHARCCRDGCSSVRRLSKSDGSQSAVDSAQRTLKVAHGSSHADSAAHVTGVPPSPTAGPTLTSQAQSLLHPVTPTTGPRTS